MNKVSTNKLNNQLIDKENSTWDKDGRLRIVDDGKEICVEYYENGKPKNKTSYENGKKDGVQLYWYDNDQVWFNWFYKNGEKQGVQTTYNRKGEKISEHFYKDGKLQEKRTMFTLDDLCTQEDSTNSIASTEFSSDLAKIVCAQQARAVRREEFKQKCQDSLDQQRYRTQDVVSYTYQTLCIAFIVSSKNVKENMETVETDYYDTGEIKSKECFHNGQKTNEQIGYYKNGRIKYVHYYKNDEMDGVQLQWYPDGTLQTNQVYKNGTLQPNQVYT